MFNIKDDFHITENLSRLSFSSGSHSRVKSADTLYLVTQNPEHEI